MKQTNRSDEAMFDEIFRSDDDISPFGVDFTQKKMMKMKILNQGFNELMSILNKRNEVIQPIGGMVVAYTPVYE